MKREKLEGRDEGGTQYLSQSEVDKKMQSVKADVKSDYRNRLIAELYETEKLTQTEIADAVGLTQSTVNKILKNR
ncbi:MAG: transcriptional regulator, contains sigma factor-related N-terminal domain protein [Haloquadratum sp. J07HQX50]|jgi:Helix-turn-helix.|nr:MAG: transcriptional regulator, contains sigma factor-related N-terminal domain protein [Haloquadratum sp. J07HQX50]